MIEHLAEQLRRKALSRRNFLAGAGVAAAATVSGCGDDSKSPTIPATTTTATPATDVDILNFALNLEYLEAEFYLRAATGSGLSSADSLGGGTVTAKSGPVTFSNTLFSQIAFEIAQTELQHVRAIQATIKALGGTPVARPNLNYTDTFNTVAATAGLGSFDPFASDLAFFVGALTFEDVGVTAYTGAAHLLTNSAVLDAATGIQAAEAYHAGSLRSIIAGYTLSSGDQTYLNAYNGVISVRAKLDGTGHETMLTTGGVNGMVVTPSTIVQADPKTSVGYARTFDEVLHIVYGTMPGTKTASGGFFPNGLNGTITTPAS